MFILTREEQIKLTEKLLLNTRLQLVELIMTRDFNNQMAKENPESKEKIGSLNIVIAQDIKQTDKYVEFITERLENLKKTK
jgi:hypothetical protein